MAVGGGDSEYCAVLTRYTFLVESRVPVTRQMREFGGDFRRGLALKHHDSGELLEDWLEGKDWKDLALAAGDNWQQAAANTTDTLPLLQVEYNQVQTGTSRTRGQEDKR